MAVLEKSKISFDERVFGVMPGRPLHLSVRPISVNEEFLDGTAIHKELEMELDFGEETAALPFIAVIPKKAIPCPAVIVISEEKGVNSSVKEWFDKGYAVFSLYYKNISENNGDFKSGISAYIAPSRRKKLSAGKVTVWAWAAIRALEYASDTDEIDESKIGVTGKGIFALSAMLAGKVAEGFNFISPVDIPKIGNAFRESYSHLFSPEFVKNQMF